MEKTVRKMTKNWSVRGKKVWLSLLAILLMTNEIFPQSTRTIKGLVTDETQTPVIGATVVAKEVKNLGTVTDVNGNFSITIPNNSKNKEWGEKFIEFVISNEGKKIMERNGHRTIVPISCYNYEKIPERIKKYATKDK